MRGAIGVMAAGLALAGGWLAGAPAVPAWGQAAGQEKGETGEPAEGEELQALNQRLIALYQAGNYAEAIPIAERFAAVAKAAFGAASPEYTTALNNWSQLLLALNRLGEAETLMREVLGIGERTFGPEHPKLMAGLNNLALLLKKTNRLDEAERLYRRALAIGEKAPGIASQTAVILDNLAGVLEASSRFEEAEPLRRRALAVLEKELGPEHIEVATCLNNLATLFYVTHRLAEAEPLYRRVAAIQEKQLGADHPSLATTLDNLAGVLRESGRLDEAAVLYRRALAIFERRLGPDHPDVGINLNNLALLMEATGDREEAMRLYRRALTITERSLGPSHPSVAVKLNNLAWLTAEGGDWAEALRLRRRAMPILTARSTGSGHAARVGLARSTVAFRAHAQAAWHTDAGDPALRDEGFIAAQWALQSPAADALNQMGVRFGKGGGALAARVRERQDLEHARTAADQRLLAALGAGATDRAAALRATLAALDGRLAALDSGLSQDFPEFAALAAPRPLSIAQTQALLAPREALVLFLDVPGTSRMEEEGFVWAVTRTEARWARLPFGTRTFAAAVARLRCGLDASAWTDPSEWVDGTPAGQHQKQVQQVRRERCRRLTGKDVAETGPLPFDLATAHALYRVLFGEIEDLAADKDLLAVLPGTLSSLPLGVLVTEPPAVPSAAGAGGAADYAGVAWLARRNAIAVLPSVASLHALRVLAKKGAPAPEPFLGIGNPLLDGGPADADRARLARERRDCRRPSGVLARLAQTFSGVPLVGSLFRGGLADAAAIRSLAPLPETADELCAIAGALGAPGSAVLLGSEATESKVKALSADGGLARARTVHFATHGLLAGEAQAYLNAEGEPGLVLTPPAGAASEADDGLLTASEVAQLHLNAGWIVLSACNTAGGSESGGAEALSGLAQAFFYAGAKALLVSHWPVDSDAAVKLTTAMFAELKAGPELGRAEAFRRAVIAVMADRSRPANWPPAVHPAVWAPFTVVGEPGK